MMDHRKRPRLNNEGDISSSTVSAVLQTEIKTLRAELEHSQQIRSIERKNADRCEQRLKRQLADALEEMEENKDLVDSLREELDRFNEQMEESREEWRERIQWYEEQWEEQVHQQQLNSVDYDRVASNKKFAMVEKRMSAKDQQITALEEQLTAALQDAAAARQELHEKVSEQQFATTNVTNDENSSSSREFRIKIAEVERENRQLKRQNEDMKQRLQDMIQHRERATTAQRRVKQLEKDLQTVTHQVEEGVEIQRRWMEFRNEIVEEGLIEVAESATNKGDVSSSLPPEISTVVRKFRTLKQKVKELDGDNNRVTQLSEAHLRRCKVLESQINEKSQCLSKFEKDLGVSKETIGKLTLDNRKILAQENIWKREAEELRVLLSTYDQQETAQSNIPSKVTENSAGLQISLKSARDEIILLKDTIKKFESTMEEMRSENSAAKSEHERVLEKFQKLRSALMEERAKAEAAEARACHAESLAGKGSFNTENTRIFHLEENPFMEAVRTKFHTEIDALKLQLKAAQDGRTSMGTSTPASSRGSLGSAGTDVDVQKMHTRLKERFRSQIALFREGVYLLTGFKIDMIDSDSDCPHFKVRSVYGEREGDHLMFRWPKKKQTMEIMGTEMAQLLMSERSPCSIYIRQYDSFPAFLASVTMQLFEEQTNLS